MFFLLTFLIGWTAWFAAAALAGPGNTGFFGVRGPVFLAGVFAPGIAALILTARREGRAGVAALVARIGRWRVSVWWYALAIGFFAAIKLTAAVIHRAATGAWPRFGDTSMILILGAILVSTWVQAGEELGWRGYALPRLAPRMGLGGAAIVVGIMWGVWHLPLFFLPGTGSTGQSFPAYLLSVMALSVVMAWVYWRTGGSLLLVMLLHASVNNTTGLVPAAVPGATSPFALNASPIAWLSVGLLWAVAAPLLMRMRGQREASCSARVARSPRPGAASRL